MYDAEALRPDSETRLPELAFLASPDGTAAPSSRADYTRKPQNFVSNFGVIPIIREIIQIELSHDDEVSKYNIRHAIIESFIEIVRSNEKIAGLPTYIHGRLESCLS